MITPEQAIELVRANAIFEGHSDEALNCGAIPFATTKQAGLLAGLTRQCSCPEEWRHWLVGQFVEREIRSTKDISMAQMGALLDWILHGSDGRGQISRDPDEPRRPCAEAVEAIGLMLMHALAHGANTVKEGEHVEIIQQPGLC